MKLVNFTIDPAHMTDITVRREWSIYRGRTEVTDEELAKILAGQDRCSSTHSEDHPEFAALRERLGREGYISIQRGWWNGDRVIKSFKINGVIYRPGEKFASGAAFRWSHERKQKNSKYQDI